MEITIKMLKKYKDKLKIKAIELTDNSYFQCSDKVKIWLADLSFLQYSDTWYGRFGFRVKDDKKNKYSRNKVILEMKTVADINIKDIIKKYNSKISDELKTKLITSYNKYKEYNIVQWFNKISKKYMILDCAFFDYLIDFIYMEFKLTKLKGELYRLNI